MKTIKFNRVNKNTILDGVGYRPYAVGELPNSFGFLLSEDGEQEGISKWFNLNGLTYVIDHRPKNKRY